MTGRKGYALRESDARTKRAHQRGDTPGEIPGRNGLRADRHTATSLSCGAYVPAAKKRRNIIMTLSMKEKKILYAFGCPSRNNTVARLKWLAAMAVDPEAKRRVLGLARKIDTETGESWYEAFYHHMRREMDEYRRLRSSLRVLKTNTDYEEGMYDEAV